MKNKRLRGVGHRGRILIDEFDLKIILIGNSYPIMKLTKRLKLTHKNLLPHLKRLVSQNLITLEKVEKTNSKYLIITDKGKALGELLR